MGNKDSRDLDWNVKIVGIGGIDVVAQSFKIIKENQVDGYRCSKERYKIGRNTNIYTPQMWREPSH